MLVARLGDYVNIRTGKLDANASSPIGKYPFFTCAVETLRIDNYSYDCECVLVAGNGDLNVKYYSGKFNAYQRTYIIESTDKYCLHTKYLYHFLSLYIDNLRSYSIGGVIKYIKLENLTDIKIPLPPLPEQQRIATILAKADRLRRLRRYALDLGESYLQSVFLEMFGDLSHNPKDWHFCLLGDLADLASGVTKGQKFNGRETIEVPYLRVANVQAGYLDLSEIKTIEALPSDFEDLRLQVGDILMTEGGDFDKLGRGAIWKGEIPRCIHQNHIFRVRLDLNSVMPEYFANLLLSQHTKSYFLRAAKQTTNLATINMTQLKQLPVALPPLSLQQKFARFVHKYERLRTQQREAARQAEHLFQTLLHRAFVGEL